MARRRDIDQILRTWEFEPGEVAARLVRAGDGREVLQMRVEMGILQLETENRPDGNPWPRWPLILRTYPAHEEGGSREFGLMVSGFEGSGGAVKRVRAQRVEPHREGGVRSFVPVPGGETAIEADLVLIAIGYEGPARSRLVEGLSIDLDPKGNIAVDASFSSAIPGVFAAGDAVRGASLIVWAIADGRAAARSCDAYLMGTVRLP